jgi:hypothetical protein
VKDLYHKRNKTLKKEIEEDIRKWKDLICSWIGRINIEKMSRLLKVNYRFNEMPTQMLMPFLTEIEKSVLKFI